MPVLRYTASAENDLLDAWLFIAEENQSAADRLFDTINEEATRLLAHPEMGVRRSELANGIRMWPTSTPYLLFYYPDDEGIIVARILHHARDVQSIAWWPRQ
jgi:plasmid stabilization system protein ParE